MGVILSGGRICGQRSGHAASYLGAKPLEVAQIPGVDPSRIRLDGAGCDEQIVDGSTGNPLGCGGADRRKGGWRIEADEAEARCDRFDAPHRLFRGGAVGRRETCQSGIHFRQAVRRTTGDTRITCQEQGQARGMMRVIREEDRNEYRCIEEDAHSGSPECG